MAAVLTMLPGVAYWDTGELQAVAPLLGTAHPTGFPTYVLIGWLASVVLQPFGEPAFRMNLLSGLCLAVAAGFTVDLVRALTGRLAIGIAAGIAMALTPIAWAIATHAEAHTLHLALVAVLLWLLVEWDGRVRSPDAVPRDRGDRYLLAATVIFGLAVGNHSLTLLLAIPVGLYVLAVDPGDLATRPARPGVRRPARWRPSSSSISSCRCAPGRSGRTSCTARRTPGTASATSSSPSSSRAACPIRSASCRASSASSSTRTVSQYGILAPLIPVAFVVTAIRRPRYALLTGTAAAITCFFAASYVNADISRYYVGPALMAWTWLAILGGRRGRRSRRRGQPRAGDRRRRRRGARTGSPPGAPTPAPVARSWPSSSPSRSSCRPSSTSRPAFEPTT